MLAEEDPNGRLSQSSSDKRCELQEVAGIAAVEEAMEAEALHTNLQLSNTMTELLAPIVAENSTMSRLKGISRIAKTSLKSPQCV